MHPGGVLALSVFLLSMHPALSSVEGRHVCASVWALRTSKSNYELCDQVGCKRETPSVEMRAVCTVAAMCMAAAMQRSRLHSVALMVCVHIIRT